MFACCIRFAIKKGNENEVYSHKDCTRAAKVEKIFSLPQALEIKKSDFQHGHRLGKKIRNAEIIGKVEKQSQKGSELKSGFKETLCIS